MHARTTTDLAELRRYPSRYTWGRILKFHDIGPYTIIEAADRDVNGRGETGEKSYHYYVNGENTSHSAPSLDTALAGAIAYRAEGCNTHAAGYFAKMLSLPLEQERVEEGA